MTFFSVSSFFAGVFWQKHRKPNENATSETGLKQFSTQSVTFMSEPFNVTSSTTSSSTTLVQSETLPTETVLPKTMDTINQLCFQLTVCANCSGFAFGDAIVCRHHNTNNSLISSKVSYQRYRVCTKD